MAQTFHLIPLPYALEALEPIISRTTLSFHHGKHLQGYVNNLNNALPGTPYEDMTLEQIVMAAEGGIRNNAGQVLNHNLYFGQWRAPRPDNHPVGQLAKAISAQYGSFEAFQKAFQQAGATLFGAGWTWLSADASGKLVITQEANAANPIQRTILEGATTPLRPLLTFDVWEHAYYLDYQNRRPDHLAALWSIVDWDIIEQRFTGTI